MFDFFPGLQFHVDDLQNLMSFLCVALPRSPKIAVYPCLVKTLEPRPAVIWLRQVHWRHHFIIFIAVEQARIDLACARVSNRRRSEHAPPWCRTRSSGLSHVDWELRTLYESREGQACESLSPAIPLCVSV
ncbi:hypothetical protein FGB62_155g05 [Gracilaria domingensis]|nr:hypothetical protein FGB62_155g05 [Gracilaria domingensis]